jgi:hypothetical protein
MLQQPGNALLAKNLVMLLQSSGLLTLLLLSRHTTSAAALNLSPRRQFWTSLRASADDDESLEANAGATRFERVVRRMTGSKDYKFGDITRSVATTSSSAVEGTMRNVMNNDDYQFGDITKTVIGSTAQGIEGTFPLHRKYLTADHQSGLTHFAFFFSLLAGVVKTVTGNEEYQFGDLTRGTVRAAGSVLTYSEKALSALRESNIHDLIEIFELYWKSMDRDDRAEAFTVVIHSGATVVLAYNFLANVMSGIVFAAVWAKISAETGISPLSVGMWSKFLESKSTWDLFLGGPCLPARALLTIPWFFNYRQAVIGIARKSPLRKQFPIINRYASLVLAWLVANLGFVSCITAVMVKIGSLYTGVPVFPVT